MQKKYNKTDILEIGQEVLREKGYNNAGIHDVLKACNIPKGSFYNFFESKEDFAIQTVNHYADQRIGMVSQLLKNPEIAPMERLKNFYQLVMEHNLSENCSKGCLMNNMMVEMAGISSKISDCLRDNYERFVSMFAELIKDGQDQGEVRTDYSDKDLANFVINSFNGALSRSKACQSNEPMETFCEMIFKFLTDK